MGGLGVGCERGVPILGTGDTVSLAGTLGAGLEWGPCDVRRGLWGGVGRLDQGMGWAQCCRPLCGQAVLQSQLPCSLAPILAGAAGAVGKVSRFGPPNPLRNAACFEVVHGDGQRTWPACALGMGTPMPYSHASCAVCSLWPVHVGVLGGWWLFVFFRFRRFLRSVLAKSPTQCIQLIILCANFCQSLFFFLALLDCSVSPFLV